VVDFLQTIFLRDVGGLPHRVMSRSESVWSANPGNDMDRRTSAAASGGILPAIALLHRKLDRDDSGRRNFRQ
jgi:hypothetical protein